MTIQHLPFESIPQFSDRDKAYTTAHPALRSFYKYDVNLSAFQQVFEDRQQFPVDRAVLVETLQRQYASFPSSEKVQYQIQKLLAPNTFTVVTAHQPSLFTGPLYFVYKIISAINLAQKLNTTYPAYQVVPVFVLGSEDHDFEEINHLHLFRKNLVWENDEKGAVGQMKTSTLQPVLEELKEIMGTSDHALRLCQIVEEAFTTHEHYGIATQHLVHELFKEYGLVVLNMNDPALKRLFIPHIKEEIFHQPSQALIEQTQQELSDLGFSAQATAREINFFYLVPQIRSRIVEVDGVFQVLDTTIQFTKEELLQEIEQHPERFSPNVVMRPIYQEAILPNLAYIGGGGELAYWQERQSQFEHFKLNFPMLIRRNSALWLDRGTTNKMKKVGFTMEELLGDTEELIKDYVKANTENELSLKIEKLKVQEIFQDITKKIALIDPTLKKPTLAEQAKAMNSISNLEAKALRAEKNNHEITINQIRAIKDKLFPNDGLQERYDNFMGFYQRYGETFFDTLFEHLHPLEKTFLVVIDEQH